jgi:hypothetical protein
MMLALTDHPRRIFGCTSVHFRAASHDGGFKNPNSIAFRRCRNQKKKLIKGGFNEIYIKVASSGWNLHDVGRRAAC